jgi:hypothetical protein
MGEIGEPPFVDDGEGFPTKDSVRAALNMCKLGVLADKQVEFRGQQGSMIDVIGQCRIERLTENWPAQFMGTVIGAASQASQSRNES